MPTFMLLLMQSKTHYTNTTYPNLTLCDKMMSDLDEPRTSIQIKIVIAVNISTGSEDITYFQLII